MKKKVKNSGSETKYSLAKRKFLDSLTDANLRLLDRKDLENIIARFDNLILNSDIITKDELLELSDLYSKTYPEGTDMSEEVTMNVRVNTSFFWGASGELMPESISEEYFPPLKLVPNTYKFFKQLKENKKKFDKKLTRIARKYNMTEREVMMLL